MKKGRPAVVPPGHWGPRACWSESGPTRSESSVTSDVVVAHLNRTEEHAATRSKISIPASAKARDAATIAAGRAIKG